MGKRLDMSKTSKAIDCLLDEERTKMFSRAISKIVRPGDSVLDCGTGTGILAILAAKEGGRPVIAIEKDRALAEIATSNVKNSGHGDRIQVYCKDAVSHRNPMDVVILSMLDTCLISDEQVRVVNALLGKNVITPKTKTIPNRCCNFFELVCYNYEFQEAHMPMIIQSSKERCVDVLGQAVLFNEVCFSKKIDPEVKYVGRHIVSGRGWLNALKFSTVTYMTEDSLIGSTAEFNLPIYVPVHEMCVKPGDVVSIEIKYTMGCGLSGLQVNVG